MPGFDGSVANIKVATKEEKSTKNGSVMTKVTDADGKKYSFFNKKRDGSDTSAWTGFQGVSVGDVVEIGYKEEEKSFVGDDGKEVKYTQRTILFANPVNDDGNYPVDSSGNPLPTSAPVVTVDDNDIPF